MVAGFYTAGASVRPIQKIISIQKTSEVTNTIAASSEVKDLQCIMGKLWTFVF